MATPAKVYCTADYVFDCRAYRYVVCKYMGFALHRHSWSFKLITCRKEDIIP